MKINAIEFANNPDSVSCSSRQRSRCVPASPRKLLRNENRCSDDGGQADQISNTIGDGRKLRESIAPSPDRNESQVPAIFRSSTEQPQRIPRPLPDEPNNSQAGGLARPRQGIFQGNALDLAGFNFRNAAAGLLLPVGVNGSINAAMSGNQNAILQFRHDFNWHLASLLNYLVQCDWHVANVADCKGFYNLEAEAENSTSEKVIQKIFDELTGT